MCVLCSLRMSLAYWYGTLIGRVTPTTARWERMMPLLCKTKWASPQLPNWNRSRDQRSYSSPDIHSRRLMKTSTRCVGSWTIRPSWYTVWISIWGFVTLETTRTTRINSKMWTRAQSLKSHSILSIQEGSPLWLKTRSKCLISGI